VTEHWNRAKDVLVDASGIIFLDDIPYRRG
jgi:hypothetical protein